MTEATSLPFPGSLINWPSSTAKLPALAVLNSPYVRRVAYLNGVAPDLICAVCEQESQWNKWAMRFEPEFLQQYVNPEIPSDTERIARATSWGLMQVMGEVAREFGYDGAYLSTLCDAEVGLMWGARVLARKLTRAGGNVETALLLWNGGGNKQYPAQVLARMEKYA